MTSMFPRLALRPVLALACISYAATALSADPATPLFQEALSNATFPKGVWQVDDGILSATEDQFIWTDTEYEDFVLDLEFRNHEGTNSGVAIYCSDIDNWVPNAIEIQIADDYSEPWNAKDPSWQAGAFFGHKRPILSQVVRPAGQWNQMTITASGAFIAVEMNGELVNFIDLSDFTSGTLAPDRTEIPEWMPKPWSGAATRGHIGLQGKHAGAPIEFRNISIRPIDTTEEIALRSMNQELPQATQTGLNLGRGVNLSHWLSQRNEKMPDPRDFFTGADVALLASQGWDHVRLPIEESIMWSKDGSQNETAFETLDTVISWIHEAGLKAIVDLHIVNSHHFNAVNDGGKNTLFTSDESQQQLLGLWAQLSDHLKKWDNDFLAYEILNEAVADNHQDWNNLVAKGIASIRDREPLRPIVVGSNKWQGAWSFPFLRLPEGDPNLILSFHFYDPFPFTHYKAAWVGEYAAYQGPINYPGLLVSEEELAAQSDAPYYEMLVDNNGPHNRQSLRLKMLPAIEYAKGHRLPLYCGEWGSLKTVERDDLLRWYSDISDILDSEGIAHAIWDYQGSFGIKDFRSGKVDTELLDAILGE
ncbi:cellulase family glycosylhydrolase [Pelagicoccus sp. SDUM812002]|uniref:cellulase family glycosylhydrolase n=1 Tax=Pelagicoccus sp. SDUM812002 TaxID=3041266 RepID=UPI00281042E7|nr:cellulase family glycosylhydrolase [Pelagicoccus sp. SDUM812002]MDQ8187145.1 cellulase family glycosylhydrolase [Pelagicoccus sp. SDUM812002]